MTQQPDSNPSCMAFVGLLTLIIIAAIAGQLVGLQAVPEPVIALVDIVGIIDPFYAQNYQARFDYIDEHPEVAAVVLLVNSPGGEASYSEDLYFQVARLRERIPVVASITRVGASGAYYAAMGSNYIMTKPGALVGSIGVVAQVNVPVEVNDYELTSGPFKANGYSHTQFTRGLEQVKEYFASVVYAERLVAWDRWHTGARSSFPQTQDSLATGRIWTGAAAVEAGIADGFGSTADAIDVAAEIAGLRSYRVEHLDYYFMQSAGYPVVFQDDTLPDIQALMGRMEGWPGYWYVYVPPVE